MPKLQSRRQCEACTAHMYVFYKKGKHHLYALCYSHYMEMMDGDEDIVLDAIQNRQAKLAAAARKRKK